MSNIRIEEDSVTNIIGGFDELMEEHWSESAKNKTLMVLNPDYDRYFAIDKFGCCLTLVAYDEWDLVRGYSVNFIAPHIHYKDLVVCTNDVLFLGKENRNSTLGLRLIKETEKLAKEKGAELMLWHAKEQSALEKILQHKQYGVQDIIYSKVL